MAGWDESLLRAINGWPDSFSFLRIFSVASDGKPFRIGMLGLVIGMIWRGGSARRAAILSLIAFPLSDGTCTAFKTLLPMHRPFQELADLTVRVGRSNSMGTASSHAANMAAVAAIMTYSLGWKWGLPWIIAAFLTGVSRVYVGVHYPTQVLLGWTVGLFVASAIHFGWQKIAATRAKKDPNQAETPLISG